MIENPQLDFIPPDDSTADDDGVNELQEVEPDQHDQNEVDDILNVSLSFK